MPRRSLALLLSVGALLLATVGSTASCLEDLERPSQCGPATAVFPYCRPGLADPPPPSAPPTAERCRLASDSCLNLRGACVCNESNGCPKTADRCFPTPDCPPSITSNNPRAPRCVDARIAFGQPSSTAPPPIVDGGGPPPQQAPASLPCACGCAGCAEVCDGRGPVVGGNQTLTVTPADTPPTGRLGFMIRARGRGQLVLQPFARAVAAPIGPPPTASQVYNVSSEFDGVDHFVDLLPAAGPFDLVDGPLHIDRVELTTSGDAVLEIDCVVPFVIAP